MPRYSKFLTLLFTLMAFGAAAHAEDPGCKPLLASMLRYINTPSHMYSESTQGAQGAVQRTETIYTGTQRFLLTVRGWMVNPTSSEELVAQTQRSLGTAHCQFVRDESVGTESTSLYAFQVTNEFANSKGHLWISKRSGLPVKQEQTINSGDTPADVRHIAERMNFDDVKAPSIGH